MIDMKISPAEMRKQGILLAMGLILLVDGIIVCLINFKVIPLSLKQIWPLLVVFAGILIFFSDLFIYGRIRTAFLFPSVMLVFLGVGFFVFSSNVFRISFRDFISVCWPVVFVVFGIFLLSVYEIQRVNSKKFPYMQDDTLEEDNY